MNSLIEWATELQLTYGHVIKPLIVGTLVAITCSVVGCFIVLRRMSFLADAIAHSMLAGVIGGYLLMSILFNQEAKLGALLIGAILAGVLTVALVGFVTRVSRLKQDTAIGIMYTGIFALGALVVSLKAFGERIHVDIYHYIVGSIIAVSNDDLWLLVLVTSIVLGVVLLFYRQLQITSFDPIMAASIGIPVLMFEYTLTACTSLVVVSGVQIVGVILVIGLVITPAASAYLVTDRLARMIWVAILFGVGGFWLGFWLAMFIGSDPGPTVVVTMTIIFMVVLVVSPRYGLLASWIRKASTVPQEVMEDVLGAMLREDKEWVPVNRIIKRVENPQIRVRRALKMLARQDLVETESSSARLTESGFQEASRLVRAHRLWETYLQKTGVEDIHQKAHELEHISDQATVEYLDDRLGHPLRDPHGTAIPLDEVQLRGKQSVRLSLLREGHRAVVQKVGKTAKLLGVQRGNRIQVGPRTDAGETWTITLESGHQLAVSHEQADDLMVKLIPAEESEASGSQGA